MLIVMRGEHRRKELRPTAHAHALVLLPAVADQRDDAGNLAALGWDGGFGTSAYVDPAEGLIGILLTQRMMASPEPPPLFNDFWMSAYAAME
jgi:CubicO group peptidase (beta-lactamase class C family)